MGNMPRVFENPEGVRVMDCLEKVWARPIARRTYEAEPLYMVTVTLSNGEKLSWTSERLFTIWGVENDDKWREILNREMTMGYLVNVVTGEAYGKKVIEDCLGKIGSGPEIMKKMVGGDKKQSTLSAFEDGEKLKVVKLEVSDRDEMPIGEVLELLPTSTHPRWLCKYDEGPIMSERSMGYFVEDLKKLTERLNGEMEREDLAIVLCKIVDKTFRVYEKTGIRFDLVWDDYASSIVTGYALRTGEIIEEEDKIREREAEEANSRRL